MTYTDMLIVPIMETERKKFGLSNGGEDGEHNELVEISGIFVLRRGRGWGTVDGTAPFDRVYLAIHGGN